MQRQRHSPQIERKAQGMFRAGLLLDLYVHASFYNHSIAVAKHPWRFILISLLLVSIPFPFLANFEMSNSISTILREDDQGSKRLGDIFGFDEWLDIYVTDAENTGVDESIQKGNQWSKSAFNFMWKAKEMVLKSSFEFQGSTQTFGEICVPFPARNLQLGENQRQENIGGASRCRWISPLQVWTNQTEFDNDPTPLVTFQNAIQGDDVFLKEIGKSVPLSDLAAGVEKDVSGNLTKVLYFKQTMSVWPAIQLTEYGELDRRFTTAFLSVLAETRKLNAESDTSSHAMTGFSRPIVEGGGATALGYWFVMLIGYLMFTGFQLSSKSKVTVLLLGFVNAMLAIGASFGILFGLELEVQAMIQVAAAIIIAIAIDDVFVITHAIDRMQGPTESRFAEGIGEAATAILMTTVTDVLVFGYGLFSVSYQSRVMSLFLVLGVSIDFVLQMTFLAGVIIVDMRLSDKGKWCFGLCCPPIARCKQQKELFDEEETVVRTHHSKSDVSFDASFASDNEVRRTPSAQPKQGSEVIVVKQFNLQHSFRDTQSTVSSVVKSQGKVNVHRSWSDRFFGDIYPRWTTKKWFHVLAFVVLAVMLALVVYGLLAFQARAMLSSDLTMNRELAMVRHRVRELKYFPTKTWKYFITQRGLSYTNATVQNALLKACQDTKQMFVSASWAKFTRCLFDEFKRELEKSNSTQALTSESLFLSELKSFVAKPENERFRQDLMWDRQNTNLVATRIAFFSPLPKTVKKAVDLRSHAYTVLGAEAKLMDFSSNYIAWAYSTVYLQQYLIEIGLVAGGLVTLYSAVALINPWSALFVAMSMLLTGAGTLGFLEFHPLIELNMLMVFVGVFAIGLGIDFTAHIVLAFNTAPGSVEDRLKVAFANVGSSVFHGFASEATLGIVIAMVDGYLQVLITIIVVAAVISFLFSVVVVPVLLQYLTPPPALRDLNMEAKLKKRKNPMELAWEISFRQQ